MQLTFCYGGTTLNRILWLFCCI